MTGEWDRPPLPDKGQRRDVLAPLRAVRDSQDGPQERRAKVIDAIRGMAENGLDATATAELRGFVKDHKLLDLASVESIVKEGRVVGRLPRHRLAAAGADPLPDEPLTEYGYARRFIKVHGDELRYVPEWKRWLVWDGKRWAHDTTGQAQRWMKSIARRVTADALASGGDDELQGRPPWRVHRRRVRRAHPGVYRDRGGGLATTSWTPTRTCSTAPTAPSTCGPARSATTTRRTCSPRSTGAPTIPSAEWQQTSSRSWRRSSPTESMRAYLARLTGPRPGWPGHRAHPADLLRRRAPTARARYIDAVEYALGDYADARPTPSC